VNPLNFVGSPDWRSAVLALAFAAPWLLLLSGRWLRKFWVWVVFAIGAVLFPLSIAWVQVPIQQGINNLYLRLAPAEALQQYVLLLGIPIVFAAGLVQEVAKFADAVAGLFLVRARHSARAGLAVGAAAGAGYGAAEAFWIFNQIFASGFTWGTVQLAGIVALLGFIERFFTVMFHTSIVAIAAYGAATGRPWRFLFLAIVVHTVTDYTAILLQARVLGTAPIEAIIAVIALATLAGALWLRARSRPAAGPTGEGLAGHA
jgi:hypothetical protein